MAAENEGNANNSSTTTSASSPSSSSASGGAASSSSLPSPEDQSHQARESNYEQTKSDVLGKMQSSPDEFTSEDGQTLDSREARAKGKVEPRSPTGEVMSKAAENEGDTKKRN